MRGALARAAMAAVVAAVALGLRHGWRQDNCQTQKQGRNRSELGKPFHGTVLLTERMSIERPDRRRATTLFSVFGEDLLQILSRIAVKMARPPHERLAR